MINEATYVKLGLACADVCGALCRVKRMDRRFAHRVLDHDGRTVVGIQRHIVKRGKRNVLSRYFHAKDDGEAIATWKQDINGIRRVFDVRPLFVSDHW